MILRPILIAALSLLASAAVAQPAAEPAQPAAAPSLEEQVLAGINEARTDPAGYAAKLRQYRSYFEDMVVLLPGSDVGLRTREGVAAVDEAIAFLGRQAPLPPLVPMPQLVEAARELAADQAGNGAMGHIHSNGTDAKARIKKATGTGFMAEALAYGARDSAAVVRQLIVDDGEPSRPNRKILFDKRYRKAGVACGSHLQARSVCVIDLATFIGMDAKPKEVRTLPPEIDIH